MLMSQKKSNGTGHIWSYDLKNSYLKSTTRHPLVAATSGGKNECFATAKGSRCHEKATTNNRNQDMRREDVHQRSMVAWCGLYLFNFWLKTLRRKRNETESVHLNI